MREFCVAIGGSTLANQAVTLAFLNPASAPNPNIEFLRFWIGQSANPTSAQQRMQVVTQVSSYPTLAGFTPAKLKRSDPNASVLTSNTSGPMGSAGINATAENGGTKSIIVEDTFNVVNGGLWVPGPDERIIVPANVSATGAGLGLHLPVAPATLTNWAWGTNFREV